jgi:hypothetical protein
VKDIVAGRGRKGGRKERRKEGKKEGGKIEAEGRKDRRTEGRTVKRKGERTDLLYRRQGTFEHPPHRLCYCNVGEEGNLRTNRDNEKRGEEGGGGAMFIMYTCMTYDIYNLIHTHNTKHTHTYIYIYIQV